MTTHFKNDNSLYLITEVKIFFKISIYFFLDRGKGREKEGEKHQMFLPLMCPQLGTWPTT